MFEKRERERERGLSINFIAGTQYFYQNEFAHIEAITHRQRAVPGEIWAPLYLIAAVLES
jgi:hypothetical protein